MMKGTVLMIGSTYMDLYKDIIAELQKKDYVVDFIPETINNDDPNNLRRSKSCLWRTKRKIKEKTFETKNKEKWKLILDKDEYRKQYSILFVLDGQSIDPIVFSILKDRNPSLYSVNYLFDAINYVYRYDVNFKYFDKVFTFDLEESDKYRIHHLPLYWIPIEKHEKEYDIFGFGGYTYPRYCFFRKISEISHKQGKTSYIKIYRPKSNNRLSLKKIFRSLLFKNNQIDDKFVSHDLLSPSEFRLKISVSDIILDTCVPQQKGLTPRFMWALGAGKKIITTNKIAREYNFYTSDQILVIDKKNDLDKSISVETFIRKAGNNIIDISDKLLPYRIDNWLDELLNNK